jgi:hypothetical protein
MHNFSAPSEQFLRKEISQIFAPIPGGGHPTQQGGAIYIYDGTLVIHDSTFDTNTAGLRVRG